MYDRNHPNYPDAQTRMTAEEADNATFQSDVLNDHFDALVSLARTAIKARETDCGAHDLYALLAETLDDTYSSAFYTHECAPEPGDYLKAFKRAQHELDVDKARAAA